MIKKILIKKDIIKITNKLPQTKTIITIYNPLRSNTIYYEWLQHIEYNN